MKSFDFDTSNYLHITEKTSHIVEGESVETETVRSISPDQLAAHLPMLFAEMPVEVVMQAHAIVAELPR